MSTRLAQRAVAGRTMRCAIYVRISLDRGGKGLGVQRQEERCREKVAELDGIVVDVYVDNNVSATSKKKRPEWERLIGDIEAGRVDCIVVWDMDRLTRQVRELEDVIDLLDRYGVNLATCTGHVDLSTPGGRLVARMLGSVARHEAEHKGERQRAHNEQAAKMGKPNMGGTRPFGYASSKIDAVPREAEAIRDAARRVLAGETLRSIAEEWNQREIRTVSGKLWTGGMIRQVLMSARISGRREIGATNGRLGQIVANDCWDAIIDAKTSDRLRTMLTNPSRVASPANRQRRHLLSGLLVCGKCGTKLTGLDAKSVRAGMYRCPSSSTRSVASCGSLAVLMKYADPTVRDMVLHMMKDPEFRRRLSERKEVDPVVAEQIRRDEQELIDIARDRAEQEITRGEWVTMRDAIMARLEVNRAAVARATNTQALRMLDGDVDELDEQWATLNLSQQRAIVVELFIELKVLPAERRGIKFSPDRIAPTWRF